MKYNLLLWDWDLETLSQGANSLSFSLSYFFFPELCVWCLHFLEHL